MTSATSAHSGSAAGQNKGRLKQALLLTSVYLIAEAVGGWATGSLALFADAAHMLTDVGGLGLALLAIRFAERDPTPERTYGYYRAEILAALTNAVVLLGISLLVLVEAYRRFKAPPEVKTGWMLAIAVVGLAVNAISLFILRGSASESLNVKGAYFEVLSDFITSIGVIVGAAIMWVTRWYYADPIISACIGLFIVPRTWVLLREAVGVLLEGTPANVDLEEVRNSMLSVRGVTDVHDLHVWSLTSGVNALSAHVVRESATSPEELLVRVREKVRTGFPIAHVTLQVESTKCTKEDSHL
jgi:cobalt-zinc-cadmium efflux system protein